MIDVFVRCWAFTDLRWYLSQAVIERICAEADARVHLLVSGATPFPSITQEFAGRAQARLFPPDEFHTASKRAAGSISEGEWLLIVDDDQLPLYRDWVGYAVSLTKRFPEYAAIAGWSVTNEVPRPESLIAESDSIGCPMIVRRSALLDATAEPIDNPQRADTILTGRLQRHGKTGIARNWRYNHLGMGYSQVIPQHWMPECPA